MQKPCKFRALEAQDAEYLYELIRNREYDHRLPASLAQCSLYQLRKGIIEDVFTTNNYRCFIMEIEGAAIGAGIIYGVNLKDRNTKATWIFEASDIIGNESKIVAANELLRICFHDMSLHRIQMECYEFEMQLMGLFDLIMAKKEAIARQAMFKHNRYWDKYIYSILSSEWKERHESAKV